MSSATTQDMDAGAAPSPTSEARSFGELLDVLRRRAALIAVVAGVVVGAALLYALLATRLYTASAVVLLEPRSSLSQADGARYSFASDSALVDSQMKLLTSETVLRRAVDREGLQEDPEFGAPAAGLFRSLLKAIGFGKSDAEQHSENTTATVLALSQAVTVKRPERTYVMEVSVVSTDPRKAARLANAIAESYIADQMDARSEVSRREQEYLDGNIDQLRKKIETSEKAVETYKEQNRIIGASGKLVNEQMLSEVNTELAAARTKVSEARARYDQVRQIVASGRSIETLPDALKSPVIDKLRIQFAEIVRQEANAKTTLGERHPQYREIQQQLRDTRRLITEELGRIGEGARNDMRAAEANEVNLTRQVEQLKTEATTTNQSSVRLRELEREVDTSKAVLDNLLKAKGNVTRDSVDMPIARIIARAAPPTGPSSPRRIPIMLLAATIGIGLGVVSAFAAEGMGAATLRRAPAAASPAWTSLRLPAFGTADSAATDSTIRQLATRIPVRPPGGGPATCLLINCGAPFADVLALALARACRDSERSTLLIEMSARAGKVAHGLARDLPVGAVTLDEGENAIGILADDNGGHHLVIVPGAAGQRGLRAPRGEARDLRRFGPASAFGVVLVYAPNAHAVANASRPTAGSDLVIVAVGGDATPDQRAFIDGLMTVAAERCVVVSQAPETA